MNRLISMLAAAAQFFGGGGSAANQFLRTLIGFAAASGAYAYLYGTAAQVAVADGDAFALAAGGVVGRGFTYNPTSKALVFVEAGPYEVDYGILASDVAGGEAISLAINGVAVPRTKVGANGTDTTTGQINGSALLIVTAADIAAGGEVTLINSSGGPVSLPTGSAIINARLRAILLPTAG